MTNAFLENVWYAFAWSSEVAEKPLGRVIADKALVAFRDKAGRVRLLEDRCPHRFLPLNLGKVVDDRLQCAYHGLQFDGQGNCVHNPHGAGNIPSKLRVRDFPAVEKHRLVWCWLGNPDLADEARVPDLAHLDDARFATSVGGYIHADCHYELYTDNLLDLSHAQYLHATTLGSSAIAASKVEVIEEGETVHVNRFVADAPAPPRYDELLKAGGRNVDHWIDMRWNAPATMLLDVGAALAGEPRSRGVNIKATHIVTPETATSCHYFFGNSRDFEIENTTMSARSREVQEYAFNHEDKPVLEAQQRSIGRAEFMSLEPVLLSCDTGATRVRRMLKRMIEDERVSAGPSSSSEEEGLPRLVRHQQKARTT